jgi:hypothetical protein
MSVVIVCLHDFSSLIKLASDALVGRGTANDKKPNVDMDKA